jgi:dolichol-phosphate mannosyltransferase
LSEDVATVALPVRTRLRLGLAQPANWLQLVRFAVVGASGYAVNLAVFAAAVHAGGVNYRAAAVAAFLVAVANNFAWNRGWTFQARDGHAGFQAARFFTVSVAAFLVSFVVLQGLVDAAGVEKVTAQATAILIATPLNFIGNKLWSFSR